MADVEYLHVCDYSFPGENGKPCIIGIFEIIHAPSFPVAHPFMSIAIQLRGRAHEVIPIRIELGRPNGDVLVDMNGDVTVPEQGGAFINFNLINVQFPEAGRYTIKVSSAGSTLASHSLKVQRMQPPMPAVPQGASGKPH